MGSTTPHDVISSRRWRSRYSSSQKGEERESGGAARDVFLQWREGDWERSLSAILYGKSDEDTLGIETFPSPKSPTSGDAVFRSNVIPFDPAESARER
jgi:hypothetical protein